MADVIRTRRMSAGEASKLAGRLFIIFVTKTKSGGVCLSYLCQDGCHLQPSSFSSDWAGHC